MAFPLISIIGVIPSILKAFKTVKELNTKPNKVNIPDGKVIGTITKTQLNDYKRQTAIDILSTLLLPRIKKRGGNVDDLGTLVDFACFIYKMVRSKR